LKPVFLLLSPLLCGDSNNSSLVGERNGEALKARCWMGWRPGSPCYVLNTSTANHPSTNLLQNLLQSRSTCIHSSSTLQHTRNLPLKAWRPSTEAKCCLVPTSPTCPCELCIEVVLSLENHLLSTARFSHLGENPPDSITRSPYRYYSLLEGTTWGRPWSLGQRGLSTHSFRLSRCCFLSFFLKKIFIDCSEEVGPEEEAV